MKKWKLLNLSKMNALLFLVSFSMWLYSVNCQYRFNCYENYCSFKENKCPSFSCENGRTIENATKCGCCPLCIKNLKEGEECHTEYYQWVKGIAECGPGLICKAKSEKKGKCEPSECLQRLRNYENEYSYENKSLLKPTFECDHFGKFEPSEDDSSKPHVVCINDVLCFCVDKNGKRIFGTDYSTSVSDMNCDCSRDINDFPKVVDFEKLPRCLPNGNYDPLQCVEGKCFCMEYDSDELFDAENMEKLYCYTDDRRPEQNLKTKCLKQREEEIKRFTDENVIVIGAESTHCEVDGTYYPLQCKKGRCFCVKRNGDLHIGFEDIKKEEGDLTCRCMRDKEIIESFENKKTNSMKIFESIICDGNYTSNNTILSEIFINDFIKP